MFERFTDRARRAMVLAGNLGQRDADNKVVVDTGLLLTGVIHARKPVLFEVLSSQGLAVDSSEENSSGRVPPVPFTGVLTTDAKAALAAAHEASLQEGGSAIDTRHLLLGLLTVDEPLVSRQLASVGVDVAPSPATAPPPAAGERPPPAPAPCVDA